MNCKSICLTISLFCFFSSLAPAQALQLCGKAKQGEILVGHADKGESIVFNKQKLRMSPSGEFLIAFGRDDKKTQYLTLTEAAYADPQEGLKAVMSPPLRTQADCDALWQGLQDGVIDAVATDHCPFRFAVEKQFGAGDFTACPNGAPGVEERMKAWAGSILSTVHQSGENPR